MSTSLKRLFKVLLIFPTLGMGLYFLIEKGAKADLSFSLNFLQNYFSLIRDIFFNIRVEIADEIELNMLYERSLPFTSCLLDTSPETHRVSSLYWKHLIVNKAVLVCKMLEGALPINQTNIRRFNKLDAVCQKEDKNVRITTQNVDLLVPSCCCVSGMQYYSSICLLMI